MIANHGAFEIIGHLKELCTAKLILAFLLIEFLPVPVCGQSVRGGTAIFFLISKNGNYVVIAADSRQSDKNSGIHNDQECKIIVLGDKTIFFCIWEGRNDCHWEGGGKSDSDGKICRQ